MTVADSSLQKFDRLNLFVIGQKLSPLLLKLKTWILIQLFVIGLKPRPLWDNYPISLKFGFTLEAWISSNFPFCCLLRGAINFLRFKSSYLNVADKDSNLLVGLSN